MRHHGTVAKRLLITLAALLIAAVCGLIAGQEQERTPAAQEPVEAPADALFSAETVQAVYICMDAIGMAGTYMSNNDRPTDLDHATEACWQARYKVERDGGDTEAAQQIRAIIFANQGALYDTKALINRGKDGEADEKAKRWTDDADIERLTELLATTA